jgi:hypothetical protein
MWTRRQTNDWPILDSSFAPIITFGMENLRDFTGQEASDEGWLKENSVNLET